MLPRGRRLALAASIAVAVGAWAPTPRARAQDAPRAEPVAPAPAQAPAPSAPAQPPVSVPAPATSAPAPEAEPAPVSGAPSAKPALTPPRLAQFKEAVYPEAAFAAGVGARVVVEIVVGTDGRVKDAKVVEPAGQGFDEAALAAVKEFVFEPATQNGKPINARVRYPYVFEIRAQTPAVAPEAPPLPGRLEGRVLAVENDKPLAGLTVTVSNEDASQMVDLVTDADGRFSLADLEPGLYFVKVEGGEAREDSDQKEWIKPDKATEVVFRLEEPPDPDTFVAVARIQAPPREVTRRSIGKAEVARIPGTRGDALRTVELMPGVARPPMGAGVLIVRGSAPGDTQALFEGLPVPLLYHFGGLTSFVNSRLLEGIEFYPGNFSVRYGRRRGGVVEVRAGDPAEDKLHGVADVNLIDASVLVHGPVTEDLSVAVAGRRSYFDVMFENLAPEGVSTIAAPVYYDYQTILNWRPTEDDKVRLMVFGSDDKFALLFNEPSDTDASISGDLDFGTAFHRAHGSWRRHLSEDVDQDIDIAAGVIDVDFGLGEAFDFELSGTDIYGRSEWRGRVTDDVRLIGGLDVFVLPGRFDYSGPPVQQTEGNPDRGASATAISNRDRIESSSDFTLVQPAVYVESDLTVDRARFLLGSRVDYYEEIQEHTFDPRLTVLYSLTETTTLRGGVGMFSQPPEFQESSPQLGNPSLEPTHTVHLGTGVDQKIGEGFSVGVDGFYKHLYDRVVGTEFGQAPFFVNDGEGRIYGLELQAKLVPKGRFFGYLSYTLSRSERRDHEAPWRVFDFDQPHILTAVGMYKLGRGWEVGATFRLVSGSPETPIQGASEDTTTGLYSPIYGRVNSVRAPTFNRLDLRVEKLWTFSAWKLAFYADVQNVYNATNSEGTIYDYRYRESTDVRGLPIIPNLGLRGEM
jgi:TonB family protein